MVFQLFWSITFLASSIWLNLSLKLDYFFLYSNFYSSVNYVYGFLTVDSDIVIDIDPVSEIVWELRGEETSELDSLNIPSS